MIEADTTTTVREGHTTMVASSYGMLRVGARLGNAALQIVRASQASEWRGQHVRLGLCEE